MRIGFTTFLAALALLPLTSLALAQDVAAGRAHARQVCAECHVVDGSGVRDGGKAPGFADVARMPSTTELSLKVFLQSPHASMPSINLTQRELDDMVAYILSLNNRT